MSQDALETSATIILSVMASSGFWAWVLKRGDSRKASTQLLLGIAHDRIIFLGMSYIDRGWISKDEYEDLIKYLYAPYSQFGGNGLAEKVMDEVKKLPIKNTSNHPRVQILKDKNESHE